MGWSYPGLLDQGPSPLCPIGQRRCAPRRACSLSAASSLVSLDSAQHPPISCSPQMQLGQGMQASSSSLLQLHISTPVCNAVRLRNTSRLKCSQEASSVRALHLSCAPLLRSAAACCHTCQSKSCWLPLSASSVLSADALSARASTPLSGRGLHNRWDIDPEDVEILKTGDGDLWLLGEGSFGKVGGARASHGLSGGTF